MPRPTIHLLHSLIQLVLYPVWERFPGCSLIELFTILRSPVSTRKIILG